MDKKWNVYLSGEIHTDWREQISSGAVKAALPVSFSSPVTDHGASDMCGVNILGAEDKPFWQDRKGAGLNAIRTSTLISNADVGRQPMRSARMHWFPNDVSGRIRT